MTSQIYDSDSYLRHFYLVAEPFSLTPDPEFLFLSDGHADGLAALGVGVMEKRGLTVLSGEVGTGKTTLARSVLAQWRRHLHIAYLSTGTFTFDDILRKSLHQFGLLSDGPTEVCLERLERFLVDASANEKTVALIIDEAQNLPPDCFEQLRLLLNFETEKEKLLQLVLIGQPELDRRLQTNQMRHIEGRIAVRTRLEPLSAEESVRYVEHRLSVAGADLELFETAALKEIIKSSRGNPRRLNVLCHNALLFAYGRDLQQVNKLIATEAIRKRNGPSLPWLSRVSRPARIAAAATMVAGLGALAFLSGQDDVNAEPAPQAETTLVADRESLGGGTQVLATQAGTGQMEGAVLGRAQEKDPGATILLVEGQTLSGAILTRYGRFEPGMLEAFALANPELADLDTIEAGALIRVPGSLEAEHD